MCESCLFCVQKKRRTAGERGIAGGLGKRVGERAPARAFDRYERGSAWLRGAGGVKYDDVYDVYAYGIGNASAPKRKFVASFLHAHRCNPHLDAVLDGLFAGPAHISKPARVFFQCLKSEPGR